ncbi:MAG TPA: DUF6443 domain-containing protein, partial [Saprospiraceae bacterium]|nr:DUF6443 domain-containing protein [Saprospiraceae bacterium]
MGRTVQTVRKGQAPNGYDIVQAVAYDNRGRAHKQYETQSNNGSGSYHSPQGGWEYALTEYEPFPLGRVVKVTPLGEMGPVEYSYGHNTTDYEVLVLPSPFIWPDNKLY